MSELDDIPRVLLGLACGDQLAARWVSLVSFWSVVVGRLWVVHCFLDLGRYDTPRPRLQLLTVAQAADLLKVSDRTIRRWIDAKKVPYLKLPNGGYRIPQASLLASPSGIYDLGAKSAAFDERFADS